jgi:acetyl esterase/lipase
MARWFRPRYQWVFRRPRSVVVGLVLAAIVVAATPGVPFAALPRFADVAYGSRPDQRLDLTLPDPQRFPGDRPVIVWLHAGGWEAGSRKDPAPFPMRQVARGYAVANVDYGLAPRLHYPTSLHDIELAITWLRRNASAFALDPSRVVVAGYSAGAELAALVARNEPRNVRGVIGISGGYNLVAMSRSRNPWEREAAGSLVGRVPGAAAAATVADSVAAGIPPLFVIHARVDPLFPYNEQVAAMVAAWSRVSSVVVQLVGGGHGIDFAHLDTRRVDGFIDEVTARVERSVRERTDESRRWRGDAARRRVREKPATYVVCTDDLGLPTALQQSNAKRVANFVERPTSHSPFLSGPGDLAEIITGLARG